MSYSEVLWRNSSLGKYDNKMSNEGRNSIKNNEAQTLRKQLKNGDVDYVFLRKSKAKLKRKLIRGAILGAQFDSWRMSAVTELSPCSFHSWPATISIGPLFLASLDETKLTHTNTHIAMRKLFLFSNLL